MPVSINNTTLTFNDGTTMTTAAGAGAAGAQLFTSNGTFTVPAGASNLTVYVLGGGGGGGGGRTDNGATEYRGGTGGSGGFAFYYGQVNPGQSFNVTIGGGGGGGSIGGGGSGSQSNFGGVCVSNGGGGGGGAEYNNDGGPAGNGGPGNQVSGTSVIHLLQTNGQYGNGGVGAQYANFPSASTGSGGNPGAVAVYWG